MSVGRICTRIVATATPEESVLVAARRMEENNVGTLVVVDEARRPRGIVTDRDIVTRAVAVERPPHETPVKAVMTPEVRSVDEATPIEQAVSTMASIGVRRLVVTGSDGLLLGLLSLDDVLELLAEEAESIGQLLRKELPALQA